MLNSLTRWMWLIFGFVTLKDRRASHFGFRPLRTSFIPILFVNLRMGRYLVVEYKGADRWSNDDSKEKRRLGELWALKSGGRCLFVMPKGKDWEAIKEIMK